jgi:hypothetical protein
MARSEYKTKSYALTVSTQNLEAFDITNYSGVSLSLIGPGTGAGSVKLQQSNDQTNWRDISGATDTVASGFGLVNFHGLHSGFVRGVVTLSAGAGTYEVKYIAKDF